MASRNHICATCGKQYQHNTHLRRHEATHHGQKFKCSTCHKQFARGDVCRKHMLSCGTQTPSELRRGRKPGACEACFIGKASCDKVTPCSRCVSKGITCKPRGAVETGRSSTSTLPAQSFLRGMFNPSQSTMLEYLGKDNDKAGDNPAADMVNLDGLPEMDDLLSMFPWDMATMLDDAIRNFNPENMDMNMLSIDTPASFPSFSETSSTFDDASRSIVKDLHALHCTLFTSDPSYSESFDMSNAEKAFSSSNIKLYCNAFFKLTHTHFPIVHPASFGVSTRQSLLMAVTIAGAFRTPLREDVVTARKYMRLMEEFIYRELAAVQDVNAESLQTLQAAVIMVYLLMLNNNVATRKRCRTLRVPIIAEKIRNLKLIQRPHNGDVFSETCIRIIAWTALGDWHQSSLLNVSPLISIFEMTCPMPCDEAIWDSGSYSIIPSTKTVRGCMAKLLGQSYTPFPVTITDLSTISGAISAHVISSHLNLSLEYGGAQIKRAISRWHDLWNIATSTVDESAMLKMGMARHAPETIGFMSAVIDAVAAGSTHPYLANVGHDTLEELFSFLVQCTDKR